MNRIEEIIKILSHKYPKPKTELYFNTPFELLVATILSAQSTDKQVNKVTKKLFKKYNKPAEFAILKPEELEKEINSIGLYHNKSKYIIESSKIIANKFKGCVPQSRSELMLLPGVGRKTANVVLICAFSKNAFPVDTHVFRVSNRLGLVNSQKTKDVEEGLKELIPENKWSDMHHWLILHGRETCKSRKPECVKCLLGKYCNFNNTENIP